MAGHTLERIFSDVEMVEFRAVADRLGSINPDEIQKAIIDMDELVNRIGWEKCDDMSEILEARMSFLVGE